MIIPKNKITPSQFTKGIYDPSYVPREVNLNDLVQEVVIPAKQQEASEKVKKRVQQTPGVTVDPPTANKVPIPLTLEESEEATRQIAQTLARIQIVRNKINETRVEINKSINSELDDKELSFKVDISKKHSVERALKRLYGEKREEITYTMYLEMLAARAKLEAKEVEDYSKGKTKQEDEDSDKKSKKE